MVTSVMIRGEPQRPDSLQIYKHKKYIYIIINTNIQIYTYIHIYMNNIDSQKRHPNQGPVRFVTGKDP